MAASSSSAVSSPRYISLQNNMISENISNGRYHKYVFQKPNKVTGMFQELTVTDNRLVIQSSKLIISINRTSGEILGVSHIDGLIPLSKYPMIDHKDIISIRDGSNHATYHLHNQDILHVYNSAVLHRSPYDNYVCRYEEYVVEKTDRHLIILTNLCSEEKTTVALSFKLEGPLQHQTMRSGQYVAFYEEGKTTIDILDVSTQSVYKTVHETSPIIELVALDWNMLGIRTGRGRFSTLDVCTGKCVEFLGYEFSSCSNVLFNNKFVANLQCSYSSEDHNRYQIKLWDWKSGSVHKIIDFTYKYDLNRKKPGFFLTSHYVGIYDPEKYEFRVWAINTGAIRGKIGSVVIPLDKGTQLAISSYDSDVVSMPNPGNFYSMGRQVIDFEAMQVRHLAKWDDSKLTLLHHFKQGVFLETRKHVKGFKKKGDTITVVDYGVLAGEKRIERKWKVSRLKTGEIVYK